MNKYSVTLTNDNKGKTKSTKDQIKKKIYKDNETKAT